MCHIKLDQGSEAQFAVNDAAYDGLIVEIQWNTWQFHSLSQFHIFWCCGLWSASFILYLIPYTLYLIPYTLYLIYTVDIHDIYSVFCFSFLTGTRDWVQWCLRAFYIFINANQSYLAPSIACQILLVWVNLPYSQLIDLYICILDASHLGPIFNLYWYL